eukprot:PhM_4_TR3739/c0_g1_i2/m.15008/K04949/CNGA2; cyclic nucleotide gated channel alpha 2
MPPPPSHDFAEHDDLNREVCRITRKSYRQTVLGPREPPAYVSLVEFILIAQACRKMHALARGDNEAGKARVESMLRAKHITPDSRIRWTVDAAVMCSVLYIVILVTLEDVREDVQLWQQALYPIASVVLGVDFIMNFIIPRPGADENGSHKEVVIAYLKNWRFYVDLLAVGPWYLLVSSDSFMNDVLRHVRLLKMFRIHDLFSFSELFPRYTPFLMFAKAFAVSKIRMAAWLVIFVHGLCVGWMALRSEYTYDEVIYFVMYTLLTIGLGDPKYRAETTTEQAYMGFQCACGALFNGFIISQMGTVLEDAQRAKSQDQLLSLVNLMRYFKTPLELQSAVLAVHKFKEKVDMSAANREITGMLPQKLRDRILTESKVEAVRRSPGLRELCYGAQRELVRVMAERHFSPSEFIIVAREEGEEMHVLTYGFVDVRNPRGTFQGSFGSGLTFGENVVLDPHARCYTKSVISLAYCVTLAVEKQDFARVCETYPEVAGHVERHSVTARLYNMKQQQCSGSISGGDIDNHVPDDDDEMTDKNPAQNDVGGSLFSKSQPQTPRSSITSTVSEDLANPITELRQAAATLQNNIHQFSKTQLTELREMKKQLSLLHAQRTQQYHHQSHQRATSPTFVVDA